jgi:hypothetical protein
MPSPPQPTDLLATMPSQEPERSAEAIRRVLPELIKLSVNPLTSEVSFWRSAAE